jgi:hypothetical protein
MDPQRINIIRSILSNNEASNTLLLNSDSSSDDDDDYHGPRRQIPKVKDILETCFDIQDDDTFRTHFRFNRPVFQKLLLKLSSKLVSGPQRNNSRGRPPITAEKTLMIALWILGTKDSYRYLLNF